MEIKRTVISVFMAALMLAIPLSAAALTVDADSIYTEYKFYTANVYVCDTSTGEIILRNVKPMNISDGNAGAQALEYKAVKINRGNMFEQDGKKLTFDVINGYLLDRSATVLVGRCKRGYRVLYLCI